MGSNSFFSYELRRLRKLRGWSQEELADRMNFSVSIIQKVELGSRPPSEDFAEATDRAFGLPEEFTNHFKEIRERELEQPVVPNWFQEYSEREREATRIWWFELSMVPGILQIEEYARALLGSEARVTARMERRGILTRDNPPSFVVIIAERALRHLVGDAKIMRMQLEHLATMVEKFVIQVLPADCGTYLHLDGPFTIVTIDGRDFAYAETPLLGVVRSEPEVVSEAKERWDRIRGEALSRKQTIELIQEVAQQWT